MILHFCELGKFTSNFIDLVNSEFSNQKHYFLTYGDRHEFPFKTASNVEYHPRPLSFLGKVRYRIVTLFRFLALAKKSEKIIIHGLWRSDLVKLLFFYPELLKKCYWVMWGGDLYFYKFRQKGLRSNINEFFRRRAIRRMGNLITYIKGDYELAKEWYGATGRYHECLMYTSNLYKEYCVPEKKTNTISVLVGNSADPTNNHLDVLKKLLSFEKQDFIVYLPLSYGNQEYAQKVIKQGQAWLGDRFKPLLDFMPFDKYLELLGTIDIAIFNHKRQQAMGNTITLLGLGKTVYLRSDTTQWDFFKDRQILVGDSKKMSNLELLDTSGNREKVKQYFSKKNYLAQLRSIFECRI